MSLTKTWQEFADAWLAFLENTNEETEKRLHKAVEAYPVGENESKQEDWIRETKVLIDQIWSNNRSAWKKIYLFIQERYKEHDYAKKILNIAESKNIGERSWIL
jgi:hypothetical protein